MGWSRGGGKAGCRIDAKPAIPASGESPGSLPGRASVQPFLPINANKRKTRRGKRPSNLYNKSFNKCDKTWSILHTNCRGFTSKKIWIKKIIHQIKPNAITMNEVGLKKNKKVAICGYDCYTRNRKNNENKGGVATEVIKDEK